MWAKKVRGELSGIKLQDLEYSLVWVKRMIGREQRRYFRAGIEEVELRKKKMENVNKLRAIRDDLKVLIERDKILQKIAA